MREAGKRGEENKRAAIEEATMEEKKAYEEQEKRERTRREAREAAEAFETKEASEDNNKSLADTVTIDDARMTPGKAAETRQQMPVQTVSKPKWSAMDKEALQKAVDAAVKQREMAESKEADARKKRKEAKTYLIQLEEEYNRLNAAFKKAQEDKSEKKQEGTKETQRDAWHTLIGAGLKRDLARNDAKVATAEEEKARAEAEKARKLESAAKAEQKYRKLRITLLRIAGNAYAPSKSFHPMDVDVVDTTSPVPWRDDVGVKGLLNGLSKLKDKNKKDHTNQTMKIRQQDSNQFFDILNILAKVSRGHPISVK